MQHALDRQCSDSRVVNLAGRQGMLSQKLYKEAMLIRHADRLQRKEYAASFTAPLELRWRTSSRGLLHGDEQLGLPGKNSATILKMFGIVQKPFENMVGAALEILKDLVSAESDSGKIQEKINQSVGIMLQESPRFLEGYLLESIMKIEVHNQELGIPVRRDMENVFAVVAGAHKVPDLARLIVERLKSEIEIYV